MIDPASSLCLQVVQMLTGVVIPWHMVEQSVVEDGSPCAYMHTHHAPQLGWLCRDCCAERVAARA